MQISALTPFIQAIAPPATRGATAPSSRAGRSDRPGPSRGPHRPADSVEISATGQREAADLDRRLVGQLTEDEQRVVQELATRDREVRAHEQAHVAAAGPYARGGPKYQYQTGPDNRRYAVGGHVDIDTSPVPDDPEATIRKAQVIRAAAMAPGEPSGQDRQVAAAASKMEAEARRELQAKQTPESGFASSAPADAYTPSAAVGAAPTAAAPFAQRRPDGEAPLGEPPAPQPTDEDSAGRHSPIRSGPERSATDARSDEAAFGRPDRSSAPHPRRVPSWTDARVHHADAAAAYGSQPRSGGLLDILA